MTASHDSSIADIFSPRSVAVIGATPRKGTIAHQLLGNIIDFGFKGMVFPVNPNYEFIKSIKCHNSVVDIPDPVDAAVIVVPKEFVAQVADECGRKGVKSLVIISAGFREVGGAGIEREAELMRLKEKYGFRIIGPNCMGIVAAKEDVSLNATFAPMQPRHGSLAFLTQSGALGVAILIAVNRLNLGLSYFVSVGNKMDVSGNDLLEFWADDDDTKVIALYLESFGDPRRFTELAKRTTRKKPVVLVKSGRSAAGARAASSHTGQLAGLEIAVDALLRQCGVLRVGSIEEMTDVVLAFTRNPLPKGNRVAIVTNAGGPGIMATDAMVAAGLEPAVLSDHTQKLLKAMLPDEASIRNPVDMIASAGAKEYRGAMDAVLADDGVDAAIAVFVPPMMIEPTDIVRAISSGSQGHDKPVLAVIMAEDRAFDVLHREMPDAPPVYRFPESAVRALVAMDRQRIWCEREEGSVRHFDVGTDIRKSVRDLVASTEGFLPPHEVDKILSAYGFPVCAMQRVYSKDAAIAAADEIGYPVVLKVFGVDIVHKSDVGGVVVDIPNRKKLSEAYRTIEASLKKAGVSAEGFMVQEMAPGGKEVILGMSTDPKFGPLLVFGMGGKYVEIVKDISLRLMPVTDVDAWEMVRGIRSYPILEGVRGDERVDMDFIVESIQRLAQMVHDLPWIAELDMNPVVVTPDKKTCRVVDARIRLARA